MAIFKCTLYSLPDFVFRSCLRWAFLRSASKLNKFILFCSSQNLMPIGFCCGGFSSTGGYVPANEVHFAMNDFCLPSGGSLPKSIFRFYPKNLKCLATFLKQSLSASIQGVNSNFFPYFVTFKRCVAAFASLPRIGQNPVGVFDYVWILHPFFSMSRRKYFKFYHLN